MTDDVARAVRAVFADAGLRGWLHARAVAAEAPEVAVDADEPVPLVSVYKLVVLAAFARAVDAGELDPLHRVTLRPDRRTRGATGIALLRDAVTLTWRDAVLSMISVSDNAAADAVLHRLGAARITETLAALALRRTRIVDDAGGQLSGLLHDTGTTSESEAYRVLDDLDRAVEPSGYDPVRTSASTGRDLTTLLCALWTDTAASPAQCAFARDALASSFGPYRLRLGFPSDRIGVAHKTGTLGALRHDVGVVRFDESGEYAVAVLTRAARPDRILPRADAAIGSAARLAVDFLRTASRRPVRA
jgi:beta-lactamase class A